LLRLSEEDKQGLQGWLNMTKIIVGVEEEDNTEVGGLPEDLNPKQKLAYDIICNHIGGVIQDPENTPQLLMNISGAAGTGKSFWPNTVLRYVKSKPELHKTKIKSAAPSGTGISHRWRDSSWATVLTCQGPGSTSLGRQTSNHAVEVQTC
jgi:hypothetical protein